MAAGGSLSGRAVRRGETRGRSLRRRLTARGPLGAALARQLGSRVDLLPGTDCVELLAVPDRGPASRPEAVVGLVERGLRAPLDRRFESFTPEPFDSGLLRQWHRARLPGGEPVTVTVIHPELETELAAGRLGEMARELVAAGELPQGAIEAAAELEAGLDLERAAGELERLARETAGWRWVEVPEPRRRLCARRLLVASAVGGQVSESDPGEARARRLSRVWLSLVLAGDLFPVEPAGRNVAYLEDGRVALLGGPVHRLPATSRAGLREYLTSVAVRDPGRAASAFLELLPGRPDDRRLRDRVRHSDPFRDRGLDVGGDLFARQVLAHRRAAEELGHPPGEALEPFYRGLFLLNREAGGESGAEPLRDGLREARLLLLLEELRRAAEDGRLRGDLERQTPRLTALPRKLDRVLTLAAQDRPESGDRSARAPRGASDGGRWAALAGLLLAVAAVVLVSHHVGAQGGAGPWPERLAALLVLLLGGLALRAAGRSGGG